MTYLSDFDGGMRALRVIVLDDEPTQLEMVQLNLSRIDPFMRVETTIDPKKVVEGARSKRYDCVVSDYQMPGIDGVQLCVKIREFSSVPFILYTGRGSEEVASRAFAAGVDDYVRKEKELSHFIVLARRIREDVERRRYEDLYRVSIEGTRDGFALIQGLNFVYVNQAMARMLGLSSPSDLIGRSILRWVMEMDRDVVERRALSRQKGNVEPTLFEYRVRRADGEVRTLEAQVSLIQYDGAPASLVFNHDVTERKLSEERLRDLNADLEEANKQLNEANSNLSSTVVELRISQEELRTVNEELRASNEQLRLSRDELESHSARLEDIVAERTAETRMGEEKMRELAQYTRSLIEASLDPLVTISAEGKITDVNEATVQMTGVPRDQLIGSDFSSYFTEPGKAREGYLKVFEDGSIRDYPLEIRHVSGRATEVLYHATLYRDSNGAVRGVFAAARDLTNRRRREEQLREAEKNAAIGRLTTLMAHDLRNPLNFICQASDLAKAHPEKSERMLQLIKEHAMKSLSIIEDLRQVTREINVNRVGTDLASLIRGVAEETRIIGNLCVNVEVPDKLETYVDPGLLRRVIENLVRNAVEAMPDGGKLTLRAKEDDEDVVVEVEDTGTGISEETIPRLFDPFHSSKPNGMGLGLTLVKRIVEAHGGTLTFQTKVGAGTKFIISLKATRPSLNSA